MSIDAVSSVSTSSLSSTSSSSSALSDDTKKKLEALGLDPTKYTTEAQAQAAITAAQEKQAQQSQQGGSNSYESIKTEVNSLASTMGIEVGSNDKLEDILDKISTQITTLQASAGTDATKLADVNNYQAQYTTITSELSKIEAAKNMTGASALANYNKAALGLAA